jgi:hypothetical protein
MKFYAIIAALVAIPLLPTSPAISQTFPGKNYQETEAECIRTANARICYSYVYINCTQSNVRGACILMQLASQNPSAFQQYFIHNTSCYTGDQNSCTSLRQANQQLGI